MSSRNGILLALVIVVGLFDFGLSRGAERRYVTTPSLIPAFLPSVVGSIELRSGLRPPVTLRSHEGGWRVASSREYPADAERVESLIRGLLERRRTRKLSPVPNALAEDAAQRRELRILDREGVLLAELRLGRSETAVTGWDLVRIGGEEAAFALEPPLALPKRWLAPRLLELTLNSLAALRLARSDGARISLDFAKDGSPSIMGVRDPLDRDACQSLALAALTLAPDEVLDPARMRSLGLENPELRLRLITRAGKRIELDIGLALPEARSRRAAHLRGTRQVVAIEQAQLKLLLRRRAEELIERRALGPLVAPEIRAIGLVREGLSLSIERKDQSWFIRSSEGSAERRVPLPGPAKLREQLIAAVAKLRIERFVDTPPQLSGCDAPGAMRLEVNAGTEVRLLKIGASQAGRHFVYGPGFQRPAFLAIRDLHGILALFDTLAAKAFETPDKPPR